MKESLPKGTVLLGDCGQHLAQLPDACADLIYLDPPFFTQKTHSLTTRAGDRSYNFADLWDSKSAYGNFLFGRLKLIHRALKSTGSVFFHCDQNSSHIARIVLDDTFGELNFRSEVIWSYRRWSNSKKGLLPAHQTILMYSKTDDFKFNTTLTDYSHSTNADQIIQRRVRDERGKAVYERDTEGKVVSNGAKKGVPLSDVWEIPYLNPKAQERVGYPTQKPILLLERIIQLVTDEGDLVIDPFCGSGTTVVAALLLNRSWIAIDSSPEAVELTKARLKQPVKTRSNLLEKGRASYQNVDKAVEASLFGMDYVRVHRNSGIDCILKTEINGLPVFIRVQRPDETMADAAASLSKAARNKGDAFLVVVVTDRGVLNLLGNQSDISDIHYVDATSSALRILLDRAIAPQGDKLRKINATQSRPQSEAARTGTA